MAGNDTACTLLLHFNGTDGSTTIPDDSLVGTNGTATVYGTAQLDTAVKTFGTASLLLDGDSDYITFPSSGAANWTFGTGDFEIDFRIYFNSITTQQGLFDFGSFGAGKGVFAFYIGNTPTKTMNIYLNGTEVNASAWAWTPTITTWHHWALTRSASNLKLFIDGSQIGTTVVTTGGTSDINPSTYTPQIGGFGSDARRLNGYLDEFRISKGAYRWTANFTPPSAEYSEDAPAPSGSTRRIFLIT